MAKFFLLCLVPISIIVGTFTPSDANSSMCSLILKNTFKLESWKPYSSKENLVGATIKLMIANKKMGRWGSLDIPVLGWLDNYLQREFTGEDPVRTQRTLFIDANDRRIVNALRRDIITGLVVAQAGDNFILYSEDPKTGMKDYTFVGPDAGGGGQISFRDNISYFGYYVSAAKESDLIYIQKIIDSQAISKRPDIQGILEPLRKLSPGVMPDYFKGQ